MLQSPAMTKEKQNVLTGIIKRHADGFGFLIPDNTDHADVYIPKHFMTGIMTNDRVEAKVFKSRGEDRFHGEIVRVTSRGTEKLVGRLKTLNDLWCILPDESKGWGHDLKIKVEHTLEAKTGDLVQVEILTYPGEGTPFTGKVIEVIGDAEDPLTDVKRVLRTQNVPEEFSRATLTEIAGLDEDPRPADWKNRRDISHLPLITIDGATAKDFDDAVFVEATDVGFHLIVAIADVSHYVKPGTSLDRDAYERGTSVYFPNHVVPMLPEVLSNGLCSLKPNVPRLCLVADMKFDFRGELEQADFYEAVMRSHARVTYGEAQEIIDGVEIEKFQPVKETILRCSDLAKLLMIKRFREGSLDLNISQTNLEIDASGNPIDVQKSERLFAHRLIEELMLAANVAVAQFLERKEKGAIYRIHEDPSPDAIKLLEIYLHNLGLNIRLQGDKLQKKLSKAIDHFADHAEGQIINILTLRSLSQAKYSSNNIGHFGLGFASYTHFTSPIRRYPDLIVHRLLKHYVVSPQAYPMPEIDELTTAGNMLSATEQRAVKCERQFMSIKKARFLKRFVGQEFTGMISSVARFGAFVLLREFDIDGLVKLENLGDDRWVFDEDNLRIMGERTHTIFKLGQIVKVSVTSVDVELGQINFDLHADYKITRKGKDFYSKKSMPKASPAFSEAPPEDHQGDNNQKRRGSIKRIFDHIESKLRGRRTSKSRNGETRAESPGSSKSSVPSKGDRHSKREISSRKTAKIVHSNNKSSEANATSSKDSGLKTAGTHYPAKGKSTSSSSKKSTPTKSSSSKSTTPPSASKFSKEPSTVTATKGSPPNESRPSFFSKFYSKKSKDTNKDTQAPSGANVKTDPKKHEGAGPAKGGKNRYLDIIAQLDKKIEEDSTGANHRNGKDPRKNAKKRGKTKNNSRRFR